MMCWLGWIDAPGAEVEVVRAPRALLVPAPSADEDVVLGVGGVSSAVVLDQLVDPLVPDTPAGTSQAISEQWQAPSCLAGARPCIRAQRVDGCTSGDSSPPILHPSSATSPGTKYLIF